MVALTANLCSLDELDTVQRINEALWKQNFFIACWLLKLEMAEPVKGIMKRSQKKKKNCFLLRKSRTYISSSNK